MIVAGSAHFAPSGGEGSVAIFGPSCGTKVVKAICRPSGDQTGLAGGNPRLVRRAVCPPSSQRTYICGPPSWSEIQATRVPSGDQRGDSSPRCPVVSGRFWLPSVLMIQRVEYLWSVKTSENLRT